MTIFKYSGAQLYDWLTHKADMVVLDVRNKVDFARFKVESPFDFELLNISYFDFMEIEDECIAKVPANRPIRIVCAKEGSAKFVAEILEKNGFPDVGYLEGGIKSWGNLLVPLKVNTETDFELFQFLRPGKASCSYGLIVDKEFVLFDPSRNIEFYLEFAESHQCKLVKTFETHLQADYIAGSRILSEKTGAEFLANENDFTGSKLNYTPLQDGNTYTLGSSGVTIKSIFTPGHTPGSTSYLINDKYLITGDTIFINSIGRPDLGGKVEAWSDTLFDTLKMISEFNENLIVLPAHYMDWKEANDDLIFAETLSSIKNQNKNIFAIQDKKTFLDFIKNNMRKQPEEYATIRLINANLESVDDEKAEELDLGKNECAATAYAAQQQSS